MSDLIPPQITNDLIRKYAGVVAVSREAAVLYGLVEMTPEEKAEDDKRRAEWEAKRAEAARVTAEAKRRFTLLNDDMSIDLLDLHMDLDGYCDGCDYGGYEGERPEWPCRTVQTIAAYHGIELP